MHGTFSTARPGRPAVDGPLDTPESPDSPSPAERRQRLRAILLMCGALACFACLDCSAKWLGRHGVEPWMVTWWRYAVSVAAVSALINPVRHPALLRTRRPLLQGVRSVLLLLSTILNFFALRHMQLAETISIQFATPLLVALLAGPLLGEWVGPRRLVAIAVGFLGVLAMTRPGLGGVHPAALLCLGGTLCYAFYNIITRRLAAYDPSSTTVLYSGLAGVAVATPLLPFAWTAPHDALGWALLAGTGLFGGFGHWLLVLAHARAPAPIVAPFIYTQLLWMLGLGYLVFGDVPGPHTLVGAGIVVASGLYLLARERVRGVETKAAPGA